jgi:thioredoxin-related protein
MKKSPVPVEKITIDNSFMRYILIAALVVLLGFSVLYIFNIQKTTKEAFENVGKYQVVYIYSNTCGHCTRFTPTFNTYATSVTADNVTTASFEKSMPSAEPYMGYVSAFPTVLVLDAQGKLINSKMGNMSLAELQGFVSSTIAA